MKVDQILESISDFTKAKQARDQKAAVLRAQKRSAKMKQGWTDEEGNSVDNDDTFFNRTNSWSDKQQEFLDGANRLLGFMAKQVRAPIKIPFGAEHLEEIYDDFQKKYKLFKKHPNAATDKNYNWYINDIVDDIEGWFYNLTPVRKSKVKMYTHSIPKMEAIVNQMKQALDHFTHLWEEFLNSPEMKHAFAQGYQILYVGGKNPSPPELQLAMKYTNAKEIVEHYSGLVNALKKVARL